MVPQPLTTAQVARRLGVKPETVYAYVSRGLLRSDRNGEGRASLFDPGEVEAFAAAGRRGTAARSTVAVRTEITLIADGRLTFRGHDAIDLAGSREYEAVATLLWTGGLDPVSCTAPAGPLAVARAVTAPLPAGTRLTDRLRLVVPAASALDPLRFDTSPAAVVATGRSLLATMVEALPPRGNADADGDGDSPARPGSIGRAPISGGGAIRSASLAGRLWPRLSEAGANPDGVAALNAALVLLADHDMAASTLAARVAASTRADPYAVVTAGLSALDGPLHGGASRLTYRLLADAVAAGSAVDVVAERLRTGEPVHGFGHRLYPDGDPRSAALLALLPDGPGEIRRIIDDVNALVSRRQGTRPNIDFALAALALLYGMPAEAGETVFAIARTAGWLAHALEEYQDMPARYRPIGRYTGPARSPGAAAFGGAAGSS